MTKARRAYLDAREDFEAYRGKLVDEAVELYHDGKDEQASEKMTKAHTMRFTGLEWREDNGV